MACHVLEVIDAIMESGRTDAFVSVASDFNRPRPLTAPAGEEESSIEG
jgi:hypothetical protein